MKFRLPRLALPALAAALVHVTFPSAVAAEGPNTVDLGGPPPVSAAPITEGPVRPTPTPAAPSAGGGPAAATPPAPPPPACDAAVAGSCDDAESAEVANRDLFPLDVDGEGAREAAAGRKRLLDYARTFDRYVKGLLTDDQVKAAVTGCRRKNDNPFCFSFKKKRLLDARIVARRRIYQPPPPRVIEPVTPQIADGRATNWTELRRGEVRGIIKGLTGLPLADVRAIGRQALEEKKCPNKVAIAVAATLEDSLPDPSLHEEISDLYEKGAQCARREPVDREHFRTRAALFRLLKGDARTAAELLAQVRPTDVTSGRSTYWLYRSYKLIGDEGRAERAFRKLVKLHPFSFHTLVAQLAENVDPGERFLTERGAFRRRSSRANVNRFIEQAEVLRRFGFDDSAALIADWGLEGRWRAEPEARFYLASLGDAHTRVTQLPLLLWARPTLATRQTMELLYPTTFLGIMQRQGGTVDPYLLLSLARKESAFDPKAVSIANAQGLCQINPDTAKKLVAVDGGGTPDLLDAETNALLAGRYVAQLLQQMSGRLHLAIASYNAGDAPVLTWMKRVPVDDTVLFIDLIPYRETRDYTGNVLANYFWYRRLYAKAIPDELRRIVPAAAVK